MTIRNLVLLQHLHCPPNCRPVSRSDGPFHLLLQRPDPLGPGDLASATFVGQLGENHPAVGRVECPAYQPIRLESIDHLGDV